MCGWRTHAGVIAPWALSNTDAAAIFASTVAVSTTRSATALKPWSLGHKRLDVFVPPLPNIVPLRVRVDAGMQRVGPGVEEHVQDFVTSRPQAVLDLVPVLLVKDGLCGDEVLPGEADDLVRDDGDQRPPWRQLLEVGELVIREVVHE